MLHRVLWEGTTRILTPYDILRLSCLNMKAVSFWAKYTRMEAHDKSGLPMVIMDMPRFEHRCPFVRPVPADDLYSSPALAATIPIGQGSLITEEGLDEFYFYVRSRRYHGYEGETNGPWPPGGETRAWQVRRDELGSGSS